ncbi:MAG: hypothetical protein ACLFUH_07575, partial [Bacteroidales bacterium]
MKKKPIIIGFSLKSHIAPKSPKGDFPKQLILSGSPLGVKGKNDKNQLFDAFLDRTHNKNKKVRNKMLLTFLIPI